MNCGPGRARPGFDTAQKKAKNDALIEELLRDPLYDVRADGTVWTLVTEAGKPGATWRQSGTLARSSSTRTPYINIKYRRKALRAHRIIYRKFFGPLSADLVINHKNGDGADNRPENLEQVTHRENILHSFRELGRPATIGHHKIDPQTAEAIRSERRAGMPYSDLCRKYQLAKSTISYVVNFKTWSPPAA